MNNAPIREPAGMSWSSAWANWFSQVTAALKGWRETLTTTKTHDFGSVAAGSQATTTVSVPTARAGDVVLVQGTLTNGIAYDGAVTADDTVTIRAINYSTGAVDPASQTFRIVVIRQ